MLYHLVINTGKLSVEEAAQMIAGAVETIETASVPGSAA